MQNRIKITLIAVGVFVSLVTKNAIANGEEAKKQWQASAGYSNSSFSRSDRKDWHEKNIALVRRINDETSINFTFADAKRFATYDGSIGGGVSHNFANGAYGNISFYVTPNADFLARYGVAGDGGVKIWEGGSIMGPTVATLNILHKDYASGDSENVDPGFVQYMAKMPVWISAKWINSFSKKPAKRVAGYSLKADWQASESLRPFAGYSFAPETDNGVVTNVITKSGGIIYDINPDTSVRIDYALEDRKDSYLRNIYSLGFSRRF